MVSVTFSIILCEILLRLFCPQVMEHAKMFTYDAELGWKFIPDTQGNIVYYGEVNHLIKTNSFGFRDHPVTAGHEKKKLMVVGDSFVSNISVRDNDVFTEIMEQQLPSSDVLNFGVNGYNQVQEYLLLKDWVDKINPDLIVLVIYTRNDFTENTGEDWLFGRPYVSLEGHDSTLTFHDPPKFKQATEREKIWNFYRKSHVYTLADRALLNMAMAFQGIDGNPKPSFYAIPESYLCRNRPSREIRTLFSIMEKLLLNVSAFANEKKVPLVMVIAPSIVQVQDDMWSDLTAGISAEAYTRSLPNDRLMQFANENNLKMIDLLPVLQSKSREGKKMYNITDQHWSAEGNRVVADAIVDYLKSHALVN